MNTSNLYGMALGEKFAQRLVDTTFADTVFFTNSGAEAVECAIKTARRYHYANGQAHRHKIISFDNAFHGRTLGTIRSEEHTSELQSLMRISYAVFCLKKKKKKSTI